MLAACLPALTAAQSPAAQNPKVQNALRTMQQAFVENKGQWDPRLKFLMQSGGLNLWLTKDGAIFGVKEKLKNGKTQISNVAMDFVGGAGARPTGVKMLPGYFNYLIGKDESKWATFVRRYSEVDTEPIYKGISARYYFDQGNLRYDLVVSPGANPNQIAMHFEGAKQVKLAGNGSLDIDTASGSFKEHGLLAYQHEDGHAVQVACRMESSGRTARLKLGNYDRTRPLVIDPLLGSTWYYESAYNPCVDIDNNGNLVLATTWEPVNGSFPTTAGAFQSTTTGSDVAAIAKLKADFSGFYFATFLGGSSTGYTNVPFSIPVDVKVKPDGTYLVVGNTNAVDFPTTPGVVQPGSDYSYNGYIADLNQTGSGLGFCTLLGPALMKTFALDQSEDIYVAGESCANEFVTTAGVAFPNWDGFSSGFITELSPDCKTYKYSSFIETPNSPKILVWQIAVDSNDDAYVLGSTGSSTSQFATTTSAIFTSGDDFLVEFSPLGKTVLAATDLPGEDLLRFQTQPSGDVPTMVLNLAGQPIVSFGTTKNGYPTSSNAFQKSLIGTNGDYIATLNSGFTAITGGTYFSGAVAADMATDPSGNLYIYCAALGAPTTTTYGFQRSPDSNSLSSYGFRGFLGELSADFSTLEYGSYLNGWQPALDTLQGAVNDRRPGDLVVDAAGNAYFVGYAIGPNNTFFPTEDALLQSPPPKNDGNTYDLFAAKLSVKPGPIVSFVPNLVYAGDRPNCKITLLSPAPSGGITVPILAVGMTAPSSVTIPAGASSFLFVVQTSTQSPELAHLVANVNGQYQTAYLAIHEPSVASASFSINPVLAGASTVLRVTISHSAPAGGIQFNAFANSQYWNISVPAGSTAGAVTVKTYASSGAGTETTSIYAPDGSIYTLPLVITTSPVPLSFALNRASVVSGTAVLGTVTLDGPAKSPGQAITLTSSSSATASMPGSETVATGATTLQPIVSTFGVSSSTQVTLTATANGMSATATLTVTPAVLSAVSSQSSSIAEGSASTGTVALSGFAPSGGAAVSLASSNASALSVPATCTIAAQTTSATFPIATGIVSANTLVTIRATYAGVTATATVTVTPQPGPKSLTLQYSQILGGESMTGTVTLSQIVSTATTVTLSSNTSAAGVPSTVTIPAGSNAATFTITTAGLAAIKPVTLTATLNGGTRTAGFSIYPAVLVSLTPASSTITSGQSINCTVQLAGNAPSSGAVVTLTSSNGSAASVPANVAIAGQGTKATFQVTAGTVNTSTQVTVSATYNGVTKTVTLTVNP